MHIPALSAVDVKSDSFSGAANSDTPASSSSAQLSLANLPSQDRDQHEQYGPSEHSSMTSPPIAVASSTDGPSISKNAQKRAAKRARMEATKLERRAREKAARKEKAAERRRLYEERRAKGLPTDDLDDDELAARRKRPRLKAEDRTRFDARVVIDLGFDDKMLDKEIVSLSSQLAHAYSAQRRSETVFSSLLYTSLSGQLLQRLHSVGNDAYRRWEYTEWWTESYEMLWKDGEVGVASDAYREETEPESQEVEQGKATKKQPRSRADQPSVVYLTADAEDELTQLKEGETYIIGGVCDHNRYKNLCLDKAMDTGIRAARLPIGTYLVGMPTRKVLTVNQVFEILLRWIELRDWEQALLAVMPKRKFSHGNRNQRQQGTVVVKASDVESNGDADDTAGALDAEGNHDSGSGIEETGAGAQSN